MVAGYIVAKHSDLQQVGGERGPPEPRSRSGRVDLVERSDLGKGETLSGAASGLPRADIVTKNIREVTTA